MKIKDICTSVTDGSHNPPQGIEKSEYMMLSSKNIFDDEITFDEPRFLSQKDFERENKRTKIAVGDVLLTIVGTVGRTAVVDEDMPTFALQRSVAVLHPKNDVCLPRFLMYALRGKRTYIENRAKGVAQKGIYLKEVSDIDIYIPDISNQEIIINKLDKVNAVIKFRQEELLALDNLIKARFVEMFGDPYVNPLKWKKLKIKDAVTIEPQNGLYKPQSDYVTDGSGIPILRIDGFYDGMVTDFASLKRLKCSETERQRYLLLEDDIVINRVNSIEYLGKCAHIKDLLEDTVYESNMMRMHFDPEYYNPVYICKLLCSQFIYDQIVNHAKKSVNQASINQKDVLDFNIYQPPLDLQNEFADFIQQVDKSKVAIQKALDETQLLFDSLMQQYFR